MHFYTVFFLSFHDVAHTPTSLCSIRKRQQLVILRPADLFQVDKLWADLHDKFHSQLQLRKSSSIENNIKPYKICMNLRIIRLHGYNSSSKQLTRLKFRFVFN